MRSSIGAMGGGVEPVGPAESQPVADRAQERMADPPLIFCCPWCLEIVAVTIFGEVIDYVGQPVSGCRGVSMVSACGFIPFHEKRAVDTSAILLWLFWSGTESFP